MEPLTLTPISFEQALAGLASRAQEYDLSAAWPAMDLSQLQACGALRWSLPLEFSGAALPAFDLHLQYEKIAAASVATALILTQRDAAVGLIDAATSSVRRERLLTHLAENEIWSTVAIAQLTTSRQGGKPAVMARKIEGGYLIDGTVPWCTGVHQSSHIVTGAALENGQQILFILQHSQDGVRVNPPMDLVALSSTLTGSMQLNGVMIDDEWVLQHPNSSALAGRRNGLTLGQTFIATGLTRSALNLIRHHDSERAHAAHDRFAQQLEELRAEVAFLCVPGRQTQAQSANARLRGACNDLALRATHAAVALYKGTALLRDHPAQRLAREAMFLLVWSCPNPVIDCTIDLLTGQGV